MACCGERYQGGGFCLVRQPKTDKLSSTCAPVPCQVITRDNSEVKVMDESGKLKTRNSSFIVVMGATSLW